VTKIERSQKRETINVEEAGLRLGLAKNAAYAAAHRGEIPTIKIGGRILVPKIAFDRMLEKVN
jgi:excisionase family DNA binding protein